MGRAKFETLPFPRERHEVVDALEVGGRRHMVHALLEFDVTRARQLIRDREEQTGERLSFTAFVVASLARAIAANPRLHAYRDWRGRLVLFDEVDVVTLIESEVDAVAIPHVIRAANRSTALTVGSITRKPGFVAGRIEPREYLAITASIDHDIVDGAPAARFATHLRELIEGADLLQDIAD